MNNYKTHEQNLEFMNIFIFVQNFSIYKHCLNSKMFIKFCEDSLKSVFGWDSHECGEGSGRTVAGERAQPREMFLDGTVQGVEHVRGGGPDAHKAPLVCVQFAGFRTSRLDHGPPGYCVGWLAAFGQLGPDVYRCFMGPIGMPSCLLAKRQV